MRLLITIISALFLYSCNTITDNNPVNALSGLMQIKIIAEDDDLARLFNNRFTDVAVPIKINYEGKILTGTLRAAGAGSRYYPKFGFRVKLNNSNIKGYSEFALSTQPADPTYIKTAIASYLYEAAGLPVFYSEPVFITVNNQNYGIYNFIERIDEVFFSRRNINISELYKVLFDARFTFMRENKLDATFGKEIPDDENYSSLAELIRASDQTLPGDIPLTMNKYIDIDNYLWYHAVSTIRSDPDSYTNNFYLYKTSVDGPFKSLPWDFDRTFTGNIGLYGPNELIESLIRNKEVFASYRNKMQTLVENIFTESNLYPIIDFWYSRLDEYYKLDPFLSGRNMHQEIDHLKNFIKLRRIEMMELLEYAEN
jgi:spore coat protein CotH